MFGTVVLAASGVDGEGGFGGGHATTSAWIRAAKLSAWSNIISKKCIEYLVRGSRKQGFVARWTRRSRIDLRSESAIVVSDCKILALLYIVLSPIWFWFLIACLNLGPV